MRARVALLTGAALAAFSAHASASGFNTARFGTEWGHPMTGNPTALYYNPAGITQADDVHLFIDGIIALRHFEYERTRDPNNMFDNFPGNTGKGEADNILAAPMFGVTWKALDWLSIGGGLLVPFGGAAEMNKNQNVSAEEQRQYPGIVDGPARWHNIEGRLQYVYFAGALAVKPVDWLSLGFVFNYIDYEIETIRARVASGQADVPNEGRTYFKVTGDTTSIGAGVLVEPMKDELWIGASYQSQPGYGPIRGDGILINNFQGVPEEDKVNFHQEMPDVIRAGVKYKPAKNLELRLFGDFVRWSVFDDQCLAQRERTKLNSADEENLANGRQVVLPDGGCKIDQQTGDEIPDQRPSADNPNVLYEHRATQNVRRDWNNAFGVHVGASYWVSDPLELVFGIAYDGNPVPNSTMDPGLWDSEDIAIAGGAAYAITDEFEIGGTYTYLKFFDVNNRGSELPTLGLRSRNVDGNGKYRSWVHIFNVHLDFTF